MDYEKKYNEALNWMRDLYPGLHGATKEDAEHYFPELRESEDERIRKELKEAFEAYDIESSWNGIPIRSIFAWLEKQKEQIPYIDSLQDKRREVIINGHKLVMKDGALTFVEAPVEEAAAKYIASYYHTHHNTEPDMTSLFLAGAEWQKEQKPVQTSEEKEYIRTIKGIIADFIRDKQPEDVALYQRIYDWLDGRHIEQKPPEWSEEDERIRLACIATINDVIDYERDRWEDYNPGKPYRPITKYDEQIDWLNSLRPRPKQNWSEEDEAMRDNILRVLNCFVGTAECESNPSLSTSYPLYRREIDWLKSLRPQPHWKPSEEHFQGLRRAITKAEKGSDAWNSLTDLYEHLKKL